MKLTIGSLFIYKIASAEATFLKSKYLEPSHVLLGLLKVEDLIRKDSSLAEKLHTKNKQALIREVSVLAEFFKEHAIDAKQLRRRLRFLISQYQEESGDFSGHRSTRGKEVLDAAEKIAVKRNEKTLGPLALLAG